MRSSSKYNSRGGSALEEEPEGNAALKGGKGTSGKKRRAVFHRKKGEGKWAIHLHFETT